MAATGPATEVAKAKVNLALHVVGRRADGYHLLDSLVVFPSIADHLTVRTGTADGVRLSVDGRFAADVPGGAENLVCQAAQALAGALSPDRPVAIEATLTKRLPVASGIGGGSADAAAMLRALCRLWGRRPAPEALHAIAAALGADVPMCLDQTQARARGIGDALTPLPDLPAMDILLVNPGIPVATPSVFRALAGADNPPLPPLPDRFADADALVAWLETTRNDLEAAATTVAPAVAEVVGALRETAGCRFARMSGSGATCFGLYADAAGARAAADEIARTRPGWWTAAGTM